MLINPFRMTSSHTDPYAFIFLLLIDSLTESCSLLTFQLAKKIFWNAFCSLDSKMIFFFPLQLGHYCNSWFICLALNIDEPKNARLMFVILLYYSFHMCCLSIHIFLSRGEPWVVPQVHPCLWKGLMLANSCFILYNIRTFLSVEKL